MAQTWTRKLRNYPLTLLLSLVVCVGHSVNFPWRTTVSRPLRSYVPLALEIRNRVLASITVPSITIQPKIDPLSRKIGKLGFALRYLVGQYPYDMFHAAPQGAARLFDRLDVSLQYDTAIPRLVESGFFKKADRFLAQMKARGVMAVIASAPTHLSFDRAYLAKSLPPPNPWLDVDELRAREAPRAVYRALVDRENQNTADLYQAYEHYRAEHPGAEFYLPFDDHWSSLGIAVAAKTVIEKTVRLGAPFPDFEVTALSESQRVDDAQLLRFLQLPDFFLNGRREFQWHETLFGLRSRGRSIAASATGRIVVAGTSFTNRWARTPFGFGEVLRSALGRELVAIGISGGGISGALNELKKQHFRFQPGDLLVWEFPFDCLFNPVYLGDLPEMD